MKKKNNVRLNLTLSEEFFNQLKKHADQEYVLIGTWVKSYLMKNLAKGDKEEKMINQNENIKSNL
jgi:hypothetical protein